MMKSQRNIIVYKCILVDILDHKTWSPFELKSIQEDVMNRSRAMFVMSRSKNINKQRALILKEICLGERHKRTVLSSSIEEETWWMR